MWCLPAPNQYHQYYNRSDLPRLVEKQGGASPRTQWILRRAAVAAPLPLEDGEVPALQGMAACFLPLPVATGLPVHVNGYFELSSNRRDIWCGSTQLPQ